MKLGYAHPIYIDIPADITVTTPQPTRIVLSGTDKQRLGLFAAKIRRWRKPEPYRGKVRRASHPLFLGYLPSLFPIFLLFSVREGMVVNGRADFCVV